MAKNPEKSISNCNFVLINQSSLPTYFQRRNEICQNRPALIRKMCFYKCCMLTLEWVSKLYTTLLKPSRGQSNVPERYWISLWSSYIDYLVTQKNYCCLMEEKRKKNNLGSQLDVSVGIQESSYVSFLWEFYTMPWFLIWAAENGSNKTQQHSFSPIVILNQPVKVW